MRIKSIFLFAAIMAASIGPAVAQQQMSTPKPHASMSSMHSMKNAKSSSMKSSMKKSHTMSGKMKSTPKPKSTMKP
jgi:hypothetical protein